MSVAAVRLCLRTRRVGIAVPALIALAGSMVLTLESGYSLSGLDGGVTPLVRLIPVPIGCIIGLSAGSVAGDVERRAGQHLQRVVRLYLLILLTLAVALTWLGLVVAVGVGEQTGAGGGYALAHLLSRAVLAYGGLALLSAAALGHYYAWVIPVLTLPAFTMFGFDAIGDAEPWNLLGAAPAEPLAWVMAAALFLSGMGVAGFAATGRTLVDRWLRSAGP